MLKKAPVKFAVFILFILAIVMPVAAQPGQAKYKSEFLSSLPLSHREKLYNRLQEANQLIKQEGIKYQFDAGQLLTGYAYGEFFDWDLYFENIYLSYYGITRFCRTNVEAFLDLQELNGFIPRTMGKVFAKPKQHFKPFLAQVALLGSSQTGYFEWLEGVYYQRLKKYLDYWTWFCDYDKNGLAVWNSADHSGMDNQNSRAGNVDQNTSEGVDLNCYLVREFRAMQVIAAKLGKKEDVLFFRNEETKLITKINTVFWDEKDQFYYDRNERTGALIRVQSVAGFIPLWLGIAPKERADIIIKKHLLDTTTFWLKYPVASYSKKEPDYYQNIISNECNWRGPTWIPANYMIFHGLLKYGYNKEAKELADKTFNLVMQEETTREYYNAETGNGLGLNPFWGWSTLGYFMPLEYELKYDPTALEPLPIIKKIAVSYLGVDF